MTRTRSQYVSPIGVLSATNFITSGVATITNTRGTNANYSGIITANSIIAGAVGTSQTSLIVQGNARITGILTVGTASITFDGNNNRINVGSAITFNGSTGIISATEFRGNGANLTGVQPFPSGTLMLFQQTSAPTGWTKQSTHDNKSLRVVTGAASSGGTSTFTSVFASRTPSGSVSGSNSGGSVSDTTLTTAQIPSHSHSLLYRTSNGPDDYQNYWIPTSNQFTTNATDSTYPTGGGGSHNHGFTNPTWSGSFSGSAMDFAVQYVDLIIAAKD
jgi:hypothetical protein